MTTATFRDAVHQEVETRSRSRITALIGLLLAPLGAFAAATHHRDDPAIAAIAAASSAVHLSMALTALRTGRYAVPASVIAFSSLLAVVVTQLLSETAMARGLDSTAVLFIALLPQIGMYLLGTAGTVMVVLSSAYLTIVFGWLVLHPARAPGPVSELIMHYAFVQLALVMSFGLKWLYVRARTRMIAELQDAQATTDALRFAEQRRLDEELGLATRIQTALLPRDPRVEGLALSASMRPAAEVGGDYYDVRPFEGGAWLCIGDVAGHGLNAGLAMLMMQSAVRALTHDDPGCGPAEAVRALNTTLYQNIRQRLVRDEHATLTLLRYQRDGSVLFAGAHEDILVFRAAERRCEAVPTPGAWMGAIRDVARSTVMSRLTLGDGDVLVLYTDGLTEARDGARQQFGLERVEEAILRAEGQPVDAIREAILSAVHAFSATLDDDITLLVARYQAPASA